MWDIIYTKKAKKQVDKIKITSLYPKFIMIIGTIRKDPYAKAPFFKKLDGCINTYSRRLSHKHRIVYKVFESKILVEIFSLWGHYDDN